MDLPSALNRFLAEHVKGVSVDAQAILAHVIGPPSSYRGSSDHGPQASTVPSGPVLPPPGLPYYLDVAAFQVALDNALKDGVAGYVAQLRKSGQVLFTNEWQYAKRPQDIAEAWTPDVQMHVASVSKLMTAMAMTVLFRDHNISPDAKIIDFLPDYWGKGPNIEYIVFRNLLNHTSGLSAIDFVNIDVMKLAIVGGITLPTPGGTNVNTLGHYSYQNLNYALCRMLLAVINGNINKDFFFEHPGLPNVLSLNDQIWDAVTIAAYQAFVQAKVFQPSRVVGATLDHPTACALAYHLPNDAAPGWNSGSLGWASCYAGWHLSVNQVLDTMGEFRRGGGILTPAAAQAMLDDGFGVDSLVANVALPTGLPTLAGNVYCKPGNWNNDPQKQDEQALAFFLPQDMELVVFVNSTVNGQIGNNFRDLVKRTYIDCLTDVLPVHL
jgi:hypothetical protein